MADERKNKELYRGDYVIVPKFNDLSDGWYIYKFLGGDVVIIKHNVLRDSYKISRKDLWHVRTGKRVSEVPYHKYLADDVLYGNHIVGQPINLTDAMLVAMDNNASPFEEPMVNGFMHDPSKSRHDYSRDWFFENLNTKCARTSCIANFERSRQGRCGVPSRIEIDKNGKCKGYQKGN